MATEKRLIFLEDAIEKIVNFPSKVAHDNFYGKKQFSPMQMLNVIAERQHEIIDLLEKVKTVDAVEVVHGRWLPDMEEFDDDPSVGIRGGVFQTGWKCSMCGRSEPVKEPYCNCGAKMDGDGND